MGIFTGVGGSTPSASDFLATISLKRKDAEMGIARVGMDGEGTVGGGVWRWIGTACQTRSCV